MTSRNPTRRRVIRVAAAAAGLALFSGMGRTSAPSRFHRWRGMALGAEATILLHHPDQAAAGKLIGACVDEIERLEAIFSLHRDRSALSRLNRNGMLADPPLDLLRLLSESRIYWRATDGAFDPTVQPLWDLYAEHFSRPGADANGPGAESVSRARALVDFAGVEFDAGAVRLARPSTRITLNGIAQGYITDRIADLLGDNGIDGVLISLGETRALGRHPDHRRWQVGLADPDRPGKFSEIVEIDNQAVATSGGYGTRFDVAGNHHHLFDPASGSSTNLYKSVTVVAPRATTADALSTGLSAIPREKVAVVLDRVGAVKAILAERSGSAFVVERPI